MHDGKGLSTFRKKWEGARERVIRHLKNECYDMAEQIGKLSGGD